MTDILMPKIQAECQMTDILMPKIQAEWVQVVRQQVQGRINWNETTFEQALTDFEQGVQSKYPITGIPGSNRSTRRISEVSQGHGDNTGRGGRGRGGRSHGRGSRSGRGGRVGRGGRGGRGGHGGRAAPLKKTTLLNGRQIDYHPSYQFRQEEFNLMTQTDYDELIRARRGYRERHGRHVSEISTTVGQPDALTQAVANAIVRHTLQVGQANSNALPPVSATAGVPPSTITMDAPTQISQISAAASSVMGGLLGQQAYKKQKKSNGQSWRQAQNVGATKVRRIIKSTTGKQGAQAPPPPNTMAANKGDTNADTCVLGPNFAMEGYSY